MRADFYLRFQKMVKHFIWRSLDNQVPALPGLLQQEDLLPVLSELNIGRLDREQDSLEVTS